MSNETVYYILNSATTHRTFLTEGLRCYAASAPKDLEPLMVEYPGTEVSSAKCYEPADLNAAMYAAGADMIVMLDGEKKTEIPLVSKNLKLAPYNHALNGRLALFKETRRKKYLRDMLKCEFIVPAKIVDGSKILYGVAQHKVADLPMLYLAFSDLEEYDTWVTPGSPWKPLRMNFRGLKKIGGKNIGLMLNPSGNRLVISNSMLMSALAEKEEK